MNITPPERSEVRTHASAGMTLANRLRERSQEHSQNMPETGTSSGTEGGQALPGLWRGEKGALAYCVWGFLFPFGMMEVLWNQMGVMVVQHCERVSDVLLMADFM